MQVLTTMDKSTLVEGMDFNGNHDLSFYNGCVYVKNHSTPFPLSGGSHAKEIIWAYAYILSQMPTPWNSFI
jgi:hypothetical protein